MQKTEADEATFLDQHTKRYPEEHPWDRMMNTGLEIRLENMHFRANFASVQVRCQLSRSAKDICSAIIQV